MTSHSSYSRANLINFFQQIRELIIRHLGVIYAAMALPIILLNAILLPPIQGVDEDSHFLRALQLSYGHVFGVKQDQSAGGWINQAAARLAHEFDQMKFSPTIKLDREEYDAARAQHWKGETKVFARFENTIIYPPFFYIPSAMAIWFGRVINLSVVDTLVIARVTNGIVCALLSAIALSIAAQGRAIMFTILSMPMTLDLFGVVSPEGLIVSVFAVVVSILCISTRSDRRSLSVRVALSFVLGAIAASKPPFIAFAFLFAGSCFTGANVKGTVKAERFIGLTIPAIMVFGSWILFGVVPFKVPFRSDLGVSSGGQIHFLLQNPMAIIAILRNTVYLYGLFYSEMFVGVLGWVDTWLPTTIYLFAAAALVISLCLDLVQNEVMRSVSDRVFAVISLVGAIGLSLLFLYAGWTKVGQDFIEGFQGRHLTAPALLLSIIVPNYVRQLHPGVCAVQGVGWTILLALIWVCELTVPVVLCTRYYWK